MLRRFATFALTALLGIALASDLRANKADEHPEEGPHHGKLVELGDEEYHAEIVHDDDKHTVTIYILDSKAKGAVAIESTEIMINLKQDSKPSQFKLAASPQESDPKGASSRFASTDEKLCEGLDDEKADVRLRLTIKGKSYTAKIEHEHEHKKEK